MADAIHEGLKKGSFPLARLVRELRAGWGPAHRAPEVHTFAGEVGSLLLRYDDVEIGDITEEGFVHWTLDPWDAEEKIEGDLMSVPDFLDDETRFVFRKKGANQASQGTPGAAASSSTAPEARHP